MSKREFLVGTAIVLIFSTCLIVSLADIVTSKSDLIPPTISLEPGAVQIVGWIMIGLGLYGFLLGVLVVTGKAKRIFPGPQVKLYPGVPIPWFYSFALVPIALGAVMALIIGAKDWGFLLMGQSIVEVTVLFLLALRLRMV